MRVEQPIFRRLQKEDIEILGDLHFPWSTRQQTIDKWTQYFEEQTRGTRISCLVLQGNSVNGYGHLLLDSAYLSFRNENIPEIHDVWIYKESRNKGLGTLLIAQLETLAKERGFDQVGIGVGLYRDYGPAQRLYFRLGYQPNGEGITYKTVPVVAGESYPVDDDLVLWLTKQLR
jgi:GNAT superfamily N-acetyltransferase